MNRYNLGGPSYPVEYLAKYLNNDFDVLVVGGPPRKDEADTFFLFENSNVNYMVLPEMSPYVSLKSEIATFRKLSRIIEDFKPDIVHTHVARAGLTGRFTANMKNVPVILHTFHGHHFHGYTSSFVVEIYKQIERYLSNISTGIIAISEAQRQDLVHKYKVVPEHKCFVIPLGFDLYRFVNIPDHKKEKFLETFDLSEDKITISIIGRLAPIKNHKLLVEAVSLLPSDIREKLRILVVGDGELKAEIIDLIKKKGLSVGTSGENLFVFTSWIKDISEALSVSDIVALTSLNEGTPVCLIEAQAAGIPVVSTDVGGVKDVVKNGETGLLVESNNPQELANAMQKLIENPELRKKLGKEGQKFMLEKYSYQRFVKDSEELYYKLLRQKGVL